MAHAVAPPALVPALGYWTLADLDALPDEMRCEIVDGALLVSPSPVSRHQWVAGEVVRQLHAALAPGLTTMGEMNVALGRTVRRPDGLVVLRSAALTAAKALDPADIVIAVEVESLSSVSQDRILKAREYAAAGIATYLRVELGPEVRIVVHELRDAAYEVVAEGDVVQLERPFPCTIDLRGLLD